MKDNDRFEILEKQHVSMTKEFFIVRDKQTGVQYLFVQAGYAGGLTPLIDREGKPVIGRYTD